MSSMNTTIKSVAKGIRNELRNAKGKKLQGKYLVIESDDWGSIRQPSLEIYQKQVERAGREIKDPFFRFDAVEQDEDLEELFTVLERHRDSYGNPAVITADYAVANPDFDKIRKSKFGEYFYESIATTYREYSGSANALNLARQGIKKRIWKPQLHCREHVQISRWMDALRKNDLEIRWAFEHGMISTENAIAPLNHYGYMDAFNYSCDESKGIDQIVADAATEFQKLFGYHSNTFVASCYVWNECLEKALRKQGVFSMQGSWYQWIPDEDTKGRLEKRKLHMGMRSQYQFYTVRNCLFEPALFDSIDNVSTCIRQIESAYRWGQPAIISSHRVNYMSRIDQNNREKHIELLDDLLTEILNRWPDVAFISSDQLANLYREKKDNEEGNRSRQ